jgi:UDP-3-O-[3-hydroxymyristoyl] glucosamine N-acyltransferase
VSASTESKRLSELAAQVGGEVLGDGTLPIRGVNGLAEAGSDEITFFSNARYKKELAHTHAAAVLVGPDAPPRNGITYVQVPDPYLAFARISQVFHPRQQFEPGVRPGANVHPEAQVHPTATVMAGATVERRAQVGARGVVFPGAYLGEESTLGEDAVLYPNVTVREGCEVGARCILHAGCVIGADGFGFAFDLNGPAHVKIPQAGRVRIEDDVEIGACSCVDRATHGETVVGRGSKIDNLVQIAHNVRVGPLSIICAQAGISGSAELGTGVILAGQVGVVGHIEIGDGARVVAQSGVAHDVPAGATLAGSPAVEYREWLKASAALPRLADLLREVRELRRRVDELERGKSR